MIKENTTKIYDIIGKKKVFFTISSILILISIISTFFGLKVAIEFKGGTMISYSYINEIDSNEAQSRIEEVLNNKILLQQGDLFNSDRKNLTITLVSTDGISSDLQNNLTSALKEQFSDNDIQILDSNDVSPSSGREFFIKCLVAVAFSALVLVIYISFRFKRISGWSAGIFAVIALIHDITIAYGGFVILGFEINSNFMAVILTILGYSINDTIVVYDRIRENKHLMGQSTPLYKLVNTSISQSFSRAINTSLTTIASMAVISIVAFVYQVNSILSFSVPLLIGMIIGTYSSLFLAPLLWVTWQTRKGKKDN